jgi:hypothetical protein
MKISIEISDQIMELACLLTYHSACFPAYLAELKSSFEPDYAHDFSTGAFLALQDLRDRAKKIEALLNLIQL